MHFDDMLMATNGEVSVETSLKRFCDVYQVQDIKNERHRASGSMRSWTPSKENCVLSWRTNQVSSEQHVDLLQLKRVGSNQEGAGCSTAEITEMRSTVCHKNVTDMMFLY